MEDFKHVLENSKLLLTCSSDDDSDCDSLSAQQSTYYNKSNTNASKEIFDIKNSKLLPNKKRNGEKRLPTRKPDPNVYNRNALLARENRRKKKIYLETIEKELDVIRNANRSLAKALKRQLKIAERLEKEKQYYEDIVKNRFKLLGFANESNLHMRGAEENIIPAVNTKEDDMFNDIMDVTSSRSSCSNEADNLSTLFDSASDGRVVAPKECSACDFSSFDFSFPEFSTDLYDSPDVTVPLTSTTWDDIWGDKDYNGENCVSSNLTIRQNCADMPNSNVDHCYARNNKIGPSEQESDPCDFIDVEGICSCNGTFCGNCHIFPTCHTPPIQLLNKQSS